MQPYHPSARQAFFGASDPKGRRRLKSPQVHELPNFFISFLAHLLLMQNLWCVWEVKKRM